MRQTPLNLAILDSHAFLEVDGSKAHLVSRAGKIRRDWRREAGLPGKARKPKTIVFGDVIVTFAAAWVTLATADGGRWGINTARFAGTPKLRVTISPNIDTITLTLRGARFPGLSLSADLTARLSLADDVASMDLAFDFCGFSTRITLVDWLHGQAAATAPVFLDDELCRVGDGLSLRAGGIAAATFHPSWLFVFAGNGTITELTSRGRTVAGRTLVLALLAPGMPSVLPSPAKRRAALFVPEPDAFALPLWPDSGPEWRVVQPVAPFRALTIETDEQTDGDIRRAILATGSAKDILWFQPGADLLNDAMQPAAIPLSGPVHAAIHRGDGTRTGAALLAGRPPVALGLHVPGCSLILGSAPRRGGFLLLDIPAQDTNPARLYLGPPPAGGGFDPGLSFTLLATAPRLEGVVIDPMPPLSPSRIVLTLAPLERALDPTEGEIALRPGDPHARITLPDGILSQIVRPRDLMVLGLQFLGARPEFHGGSPGHLRISPPDSPRLVVFFPPQSLGETCFPEDTTTSAESIPAGPILYRASGLSRLAFDLDAGGDEIAYTPETLLDWSGSGPLVPRLDGRALSPDAGMKPIVFKPRTLPMRVMDGWLKPDVIGTAGTGSIGIGGDIGVIPIEMPAPPSLDTTSIEAPYRLLLSPDQNGRWDASLSRPMASGRRAVLWHARLAATTAPAAVRALWAIAPPEVGSDPFGAAIALDEDHRARLVGNSAQKAVAANRLMLTALGAWLDLDGDWSMLPDTAVTLEKWLHRATLGRDQYVKVVDRGYLFPVGHKAALVTVTERKFGQNPPGRVSACLRKRSFIVVKETERDYAADQAGHAVYPTAIPALPFCRIRIRTTVTPSLDLTAQCEPKGAIGGLAKPAFAFWPQVGNADYLFSLAATDQADNEVQFSAPLAFVSNDATFAEASAKVVIADQADPAHPESRRAYALGGQKVVFAAPLDDTDAALETVSIRLEGFYRKKAADEAWARPYYPRMNTARVIVPAMRQFGGIGAPARIEYFKPYLDHGFSGPVNSQGQIFAKFVDDVTIAFDRDNGTDKVGGVLSPGMRPGGLSRAHGLVGTRPGGGGSVDAQLGAFAQGTFSPGDFFGGATAKILGGIDLFSILGTVAGFGPAGQKIPRWIDRVEHGALVRSFTWETDRIVTAPSFVPGAKPSLTIASTVRIGSGSDAPRSTVRARLADFAIVLAGVIRIEFDEFSMRIEPGRKPEVDVRIPKIAFCGGLAFLAEIEDKLHLDRFVDPPSIDITADGLVIGYGMRLPSIQVGIFALRNLGLSAAATLPFTGDPFRARFALSERQDPFQIAVSLFTGGGFFAIAVGLDGVETLEVLLEFGGSVALDIGVASGGVHVMAGIYIKVVHSDAELTGYLRAGGSLSVLGLITVSVEFYLGLSYESDGNKVWGEASMTVEVSVLFFSVDVTLTVRREFAGDAADPTLRDTHDRTDWDDYIAAFAA